VLPLADPSDAFMRLRPPTAAQTILFHLPAMTKTAILPVKK